MLRRTKLFRPVLPQGFVMRSRLLDRLNEGLSCPLTLISAPAGYGKTLLASSFVQGTGLPNAWLSLDEQDNELGLFVQYMLAAIDTLFPGALDRTQQFVGGSTLPTVSAIADSLVNDLADLECEFILVLDDVHHLREAMIYDLLIALLRHPVHNMHLLFLTRQDPPLGLGVLRARGQISEIRARDLRFTVDETQAFMEGAISMHLSNETLMLLAERTEGWPVGLRLAALTLRLGGAVEPQSAELHAANRYVMDYLFSEVLSLVPPDLEDFLYKSSILDTLCGSLCDAVMGEDSMPGRGQSLLPMLEQANLFTMAVDVEGQWYRYHHLFQGLLRSRLKSKYGEEVIDALHRRASAWYRSHGDIELALEHALAGNDVPGAVQLVAQHRHDLLNSEQLPRLERWLQLFPEATLEQYPDLLLAKVWVAELVRGSSPIILHMLDQAEANITRGVVPPERARQLQGEIAVVRSMEKTFAADDPLGTIALATRALELMPQEWHLARVQAWLHLAGAYQASGQLERAYTLLAAAQQEEVETSPAPRFRLLAASCFIYWIAADLAGTLYAAQQTITVSQATDDQRESLGWGHYFLASAYYQRNDLVAAEMHANIVQELRNACAQYAVVQSAILLVGIHQARGKPAAARAALERLRNYLAGIPSLALQMFVDAFGAELAAVQGDLESAGYWAMTAGARIPLGIMTYHFAPQFTVPKILLRMNTPESRQQAAAALERLRIFVTRTHNTRFTIDALALQALCYDAEGDEPAALAALGQAVKLAMPGGFVRVFVDLGPAMASLLERLARRDRTSTYIRQILSAFAVTPAPDDHPSLLPGGHADQGGLVEPLTSRELEVLELIAQRLSAKEIAQNLTITERTANRHTANIFQKLDVNGRREAVAAARALGILPAE